MLNPQKCFFSSQLLFLSLPAKSNGVGCWASRLGLSGPLGLVGTIDSPAHTTHHGSGRRSLHTRENPSPPKSDENIDRHLFLSPTVVLLIVVVIIIVIGRSANPPIAESTIVRNEYGEDRSYRSIMVRCDDDDATNSIIGGCHRLLGGVVVVVVFDVAFAFVGRIMGGHALVSRYDDRVGIRRRRSSSTTTTTTTRRRQIRRRIRRHEVPLPPSEMVRETDRIDWDRNMGDNGRI